MARFASAAKALRGPFKKLVRKMEATLTRPALKCGERHAAHSAAGDVRRSPNARSLADDVAEAIGGVAKPNKGGYTVTVPHGRRIIVVRVMEHGGGRTNYFRVNLAGKTAYSVAGEVSADAGTTHIPISEEALDHIVSIVARIKEGS